MFCYDELMSELLLEEQAWWDARNFDPESGYEGLSNRDEKVNHIQLHVGYAAMKLVQHDFTVLLSEAAPDLAIYRSQLINEFSFDPVVVTEKYRPVGNMDNVLRETVLANGILAKYIERRQHADESTWPESKIILAARHLHIAARSIVDYYKPHRDSAELLKEMQKLRMETLLGKALPNPIV